MNTNTNKITANEKIGFTKIVKSKSHDKEEESRNIIIKAIKEMPKIEDEDLAKVLKPYQEIIKKLANYAVDQTKRLDQAMQKTDELASKNRRKININQSTLEAYINKQYTEIRVLPDGADPDIQSEGHFRGGWEDYSGQFTLEDDEKTNTIIKKAEKHLKRYFENAEYHRGKTLGIFLSSARSGKKTLIKKIKTK